jgi:hypothetical protein
MVWLEMVPVNPEADIVSEELVEAEVMSLFALVTKQFQE